MQSGSKIWCRCYLNWLGKENLAVMGYELNELLEKLDAIPVSTRFIGSDIVRLTYGVATSISEPEILKSKIKVLPHWCEIYRHF